MRTIQVIPAHREVGFRISKALINEIFGSENPAFVKIPGDIIVRTRDSMVFVDLTVLRTSDIPVDATFTAGHKPSY